MAPTLRELQAEVARFVLADDRTAARFIIDDGVAAADRLGIYRNTYAGSLNKAICATYPALDKLVGRDFLEGAAALFVADNPPATAYLNEYGGAFGDFLAAFAPAAALPYLADVARVEWAVSEAANAPDAAALDPARLAAVSEKEQARLVFHPHPSLRLIRAGHDADVIRRAVLAGDDATLVALRPSPDCFWLAVHRNDSGVVTRRLEDAEYRATAALCAGATLSAALGHEPAELVVALLAEHLASGRFRSFAILPHQASEVDDRE